MDRSWANEEEREPTGGQGHWENTADGSILAPFWPEWQSVPRCLRLRRSEVLRNVRHYLRAQSQGHHAIDRLEKRSVERGSARSTGQQPKSPGVNRSRARQKLPTGQQTKTKGVDRSRTKTIRRMEQQTKTTGVNRSGTKIRTIEQ